MKFDTPGVLKDLADVIEHFCKSDVCLRVTKNVGRLNAFHFAAEVCAVTPEGGWAVIGRLQSKQSGISTKDGLAKVEETALWDSERQVAGIVGSRDELSGWVDGYGEFQVEVGGRIRFHRDDDAFRIQPCRGLAIGADKIRAEIIREPSTESLLNFRVYPHRTEASWWRRTVKRDSSPSYHPVFDRENRARFCSLSTDIQALMVLGVLRYCLHGMMAHINCL